MTTVDIQDLFNRAKDEDLSDIGNGGSWKPEQGAELTVQAELVRPGKNKNGMPRWGVMFRVVGGDDDNRTFFANFSLANPAEYEWANKANAETFHYLALFNLTSDTLGSETDQDVLSVVVAASNAVSLRAGYNKKGFDKHHFEAIEGLGNAVVEVVEDEDADDFDY